MPAARITALKTQYRKVATTEGPGDPAPATGSDNSVVDVPIPVEPPGPDHIPGGEDPDLVVTKIPDRPVVTAGEVVTYRITVRNIGAATAEGVVVTDAVAAGNRMRLTRPGISRNVAVVHTDSPEPTDRRNAAAARVRVGRVPPFCVSGLVRAAC